MPEDLTDLLLKSLEREFAVLPSYGEMGDIDCCKACGPDEGSPTKQPAEVWEPFLRRVAGLRLLGLRNSLELASRQCESPIEELMFLALILLGEMNSDQAVLFEGQEPEPFSVQTTVSVLPQALIGKYRVDFQVTAYVTKHERHATGEPDTLHWRKGSILVECDGHDFHEKTKEQASRDKERDRDLQTAGFRVFRYTGSDVWRGCLKAAHEVVEAAFQLAGQTPSITTTAGPKRRSPRT